MAITLGKLPPAITLKLQNWMARRLHEVLKDDRFDFCHQTAARTLEIYGTANWSMAALDDILSETLVKSQTMTGKINLYTPAQRVQRSRDLLNQMWMSITEDKCIAVVQALTEP